jgi:hypothetical protein
MKCFISFLCVLLQVFHVLHGHKLDGSVEIVPGKHLVTLLVML